MKFKPYNYQNYCINRIVTEKAVGLFLDMGLGKTVITLSAIQMLKQLGAVSRVLIVAPKRVAEDTWLKERRKWDHLQSLSVSLCIGTPADRNTVLREKSDVVVMGRDNVKWLKQDSCMADDFGFDMIVIDESTSFKNHATQRFKAMKHIILTNRPRVVILTGTPAPKGLIDLWAQVWLLDQGQRLGAYITYYRNDYFRQAYSGFGYVPVKGAQERIMNRISDICISMKAEDYIDMPDTIYNEVEVNLSPKDRKVYDKLKEEFVAEIEGEEITAMNAASLSSKLLQLCNGAVYTREDGAYTIVHEEKINALMELIEGSNGKSVLVFYSFIHDKERIMRAVRRAGLDIMDVRDKGAIDKWNEGNLDILLAHPASTAFGLNLQQGGHIIAWFGMQWSLELYTQAIARLRRQGQTEAVIVHHLMVPNSMDVQVMRALRDRNVTQESIIEAVKANIREVTG